jgi:hypothetical protein
MPMTRLTVFAFALLPLLPHPLLAAACEPLLPGLSLCDAKGWRVEKVEADSAHLISDAGIQGVVVLHAKLSQEAVWSEMDLLTHMPISSRAEVLEVEMPTLSGLYASTVAYRPRHEDPPLVVALTTASGDDFVLSVHSRNGAETYTAAHKDAHSALLAALKLDIAE